MVAITGVVLIILLAGLFFLFRSMGSMGQQPAPQERMRHIAQERMRHTGDDRPGRGPRPSGLH